MTGQPVDNGVCVHCEVEPCACPPPVTLCWNCEDVIPEGEGRVKDGWRVHDLCPPPQEATRG